MIKGSKQDKQTEELKRDLFSGNDATVMRALNRCSEKGNAAMVEPLLAFYATTDQPTFRTEIARMLSELKVTKVQDIFMNALQNDSMRHIQRDVLSFMWNSGLQPADGVAAISRVAVAGNYEVALEALTLLEGIDDEIDEEQLMEGIADVTQYLSETPTTDHTRLMGEYLNVLKAKLQHAA